MPLAETVALPSPVEAGETQPLAPIRLTADTEPIPSRRPAKRARRSTPKNDHRKVIIGALLGGVLLVAALLTGKALRGDRSSSTIPDDGKGQIVAKQRPAARTGGRERTVLFVLPERYWYNDFIPARDALTSEGHRVVTCSTVDRALPVDGSGGEEEIVIERRLGPNVRGGEFDAIVFVGGDMSNMRGNREAWRVIEEARAAKKVIGAICAGQQVLIDAGTLNGKWAAHSPDRERFYGTAEGINWERQKAVVVALRTNANGVPLESPIITARGPRDSQEFGEKLAFALARNP
jgi:putative intracellular protease/amidase